MKTSAIIRIVNLPELGRHLLGATFLVLLGLVGMGSSAYGAPPPPDVQTQEVVITRDSRGEPHIKASTPEGAVYGLAWAQMEDQAGYILTAIARANGKSAERAGLACDPEGVEKCFEADQLAYLYRVPQDAKVNFPKLSAGDRRRFRAFADGINDYVAEYQDADQTNVPTWARDQVIKAHEVLAFVQYGFVVPQIQQATALMRAEIKKLAEDNPGISTGLCTSNTLADAAPRMEQRASNMFALSGANTASGDPILQGDPHLPFGVPGTPQSVMWYSARVTIPGYDISGITFRGSPGIAIGRNDAIAWTMTANHATQHEVDVYTEQLTGADGDDADALIDFYNYGATPYKFLTERVNVGIKDEDGTVRYVGVNFRRTDDLHHGPVISDCLASSDGEPQPVSKLEEENIAFSAKVSQYGQYGLASQLWRMSESKSVAEFKRAMEPVQLSGFNVIAVDNIKTENNPHGNLFFIAASRSGRLNPCPKAPNCPFNTVFEGWDPATNWTGILGFDELPQVTNPASGFVFNANNAAFYSAPEIKEADLNFVLQGGGNTTRSMRLVQLLAYDNNGNNLYEPVIDQPRLGFSVDDVRRMGMDTFTVTSPGLTRLMHEAAASVANPSARLREADVLFSAWDGWARARSTDLNPGPIANAYPAFVTWKRRLEELDRKREPEDLSFTLNDPVDPDHDFSDYDLRLARLAVNEIFRHPVTNGPLPLSLDPGTVHHFDLPSEPNAFREPVNGADEDLATIRMTNCKSLRNASSLTYEDCPITGGSSNIWLFDFNTGTKQVSRPMANTANPRSSFYTANALDYVNDRYRTYPLTQAQLDGETTSTINIYYKKQ